MTSTTSEATVAEPGASAPAEAEEPAHASTHGAHRARMAIVAIVAAVATVLALAWLSTAAADAAATTTDIAARTINVTDRPAAVSVGASLLAVAWELTPPAGRSEACAQFSADPAAAWAAYSSAGDAASLPTQPEFAAFLAAGC